jgi:hypothetical protein
MTKKDLFNNPVMLAEERAWNTNVVNKVPVGDKQYVVRYVNDSGKRVDKVFATKDEATKFYNSIL